MARRPVLREQTRNPNTISTALSSSSGISHYFDWLWLASNRNIESVKGNASVSKKFNLGSKIEVGAHGFSLQGDGVRYAQPTGFEANPGSTVIHGQNSMTAFAVLEFLSVAASPGDEYSVLRQDYNLDSNSTTFALSYFIDSGPTFRCRPLLVTTGTTGWTAASDVNLPMPVTGQLYLYLMRYSNGSVYEVSLTPIGSSPKWYNAGTLPTGSIFSANPSLQTLHFLGSANLSVKVPPVRLYMAGLSKSLISRSMVQQLSLNPWQIFENQTLDFNITATPIEQKRTRKYLPYSREEQPFNFGQATSNSSIYPGLIGYWPTPTNNLMLDAVNSRHLTLGFPNVSGGSNIRSSRFGNSVRFDGGNANVSARNYDPALKLSGSTQVTVSIWIRSKTDNPSNAGVIGAWDSSGYMLYLQPTLRFYVNGSFVDTGLQPIKADKWVHLAATWDASSQIAKIYVDGNLVNTSNLAQSSISAASAPFEICSYNGGSGTFSSMVALPAVWKRVLSDSQIKSLYTEPWQLSESKPYLRSTVVIPGLTPITRNSSAFYSIRGILSSDFLSNYSVRQSYSRLFAVDYNVRSEVSSNKSVNYLTVQYVSGGNSSTYVVRQNSSRNVTELYNVRQSTSNSASEIYNVRTFAVKNNSSLFNIRQSSNSSVPSTYNVRSLSTTNSNFSYSVRYLSLSNKNNSYAVRTSSLNSRSSDYLVRQLILNNYTSSYQVFSGTSVGRNALLQYNVRTSAINNSTSNYSILQVVQFGNTTTYTVRVQVSENKFETYKIRTQVSGNGLNSYLTREQVLNSKNSNYVIYGYSSVVGNHTFIYEILGDILEPNTVLVKIENVTTNTVILNNENTSKVFI